MHRCLHFYYAAATVWLIFQVPCANGQSTLSGIITDKKTGEPVPFANVYFAHTTLGTSSAGDGTFKLSGIPNGKYDLLIEMVGYQKYKESMEFQDGNYRLEAKLPQDNVRLDSVTVVADQSDRKYLPTFFAFFIGEGGHAKECQILNPEDLHFYFDKKDQYLTVSSRKPVRVSNPVLGYTVHYLIDRFVLDFATGEKIMEGSPRFEEMSARNRKDSLARQKKRDKAYAGSLFHFMRSLYGNEMDKEGFILLEADSSTESNTLEKKEILRPLPLDQILTGGPIRNFNFKGRLRLEYRQLEEWSYPGRSYARPNGYQQTYLQFSNSSIAIYENGYFSDQKSVFMTGYLVWRETVCNMVPLGYEEGMKVKKQK